MGYIEEHRHRRYVLLGISFLALGILAFLGLQSDFVSSILQSDFVSSVMPSDQIGKTRDSPPDLDLDADTTWPTTPATQTTEQGDSKAGLPEPETGELAVPVTPDNGIESDVPTERAAWRLTRGTPSPGDEEFVLGDYEDANEIQNWTFRPGDGVEAWLGTKGVTSGKRSLRLQLQAKTEVHNSTEFFVSLPEGQHWQWNGAEEIQLDVENPMKRPLELAVVVRSGGRTGGDLKEAEWSERIPAGSATHMTCSLTDRVDLNRVWHLGLRIALKKERPVLFYVDRFAVRGSFR
jgi:hypothetical protein